MITDRQRAIENVRAELATDKAAGKDVRMFELLIDALITGRPTDAEAWKRLREPFPAEQIGKLPNIKCKNCRDASGKCCTAHRKSTCLICKAYVTNAHDHIDYVGHAAVVSRILEVDPEYGLKITTRDEQGHATVDRNGGLWIELTVLGVTRPGYGDSGGSVLRGGDALKAALSDAIKNAAMRFGVGIDLWSKEDLRTPIPVIDDVEPVSATPAAEREGLRLVAEGAPQRTAEEWIALAGSINTLDELTEKARECSNAGVYKGPIQRAFFKRRDALKKQTTTPGGSVVADPVSA